MALAQASVMVYTVSLDNVHTYDVYLGPWSNGLVAVCRALELDTDEKKLSIPEKRLSGDSDCLLSMRSHGQHQWHNDANG